jgi:PKD repeat protein
MKHFLIFFGIALIGIFCISAFSFDSFAIEEGKLPGEGNTFEPPDVNEVPEELRNTDLREQILKIINYFLTFVGIIGVTAIIYFGFLWLLSGGNEDQIQTGKKGIIYVALGIILILFSYLLVDFIINAASAKSNDFVSKEEEMIVKRLEILQEKIDRAYVYDLSFVQELKNEYQSLFNGFEDTIERQVFENQLKNGSASIHHQMIQSSLTTLRQKVIELDSVSENDEIRTIQRKIDGNIKSIKNSLRDIQNSFEDVPRMIADIDVRPKNGTAPLVVSFGGLQSEDPTSTTIPSANYSWSFTDYDGIEKNLGSGPNKTLTFERPGNYIVRLRVETASGEGVLPGYATTSVVVEPQGLTADFLVNGDVPGSIIKIPLHDAKKGVRFDPGPTVIPDGVQVKEYLWNIGGEKRSTGNRAEIISHIFPKEDQVSISLTVTDNTEEKSNKKIQLEIESSVAVIDTNTTTPLLGEVVTFSGQRSTLDGNAATVYTWKIYDSEGALVDETQGRPQFSHQFDDIGVYTIQLDIGNGITSTKQIEVVSRPPVASFVAEKQSSSNLAEVFFDASSSYDPEKSELTYHWDFDGDGSLDLQNQKSPYSTHVYTEKRDYRPRLVVTDDHGNTSDIYKDVRIDSLFFVDFSPESFAVHTGDEARFFVETNNGVAFVWDFGDGEKNESVGLVQANTFSQPGQYFVRLTAYDENGKVASIKKMIYVGGKGEPIPVVSIAKDGLPVSLVPDLCGPDKDGILLYRYELLEFSGEKSVNSEGMPGRGLQYRWEFGDDEKRGEMVTKKFIGLTTPQSCTQAKMVATDVVTEKSKSSDPVYILVKNAPPNILGLNVIPEKTPCTAPCQVSVSSVGASDPDGTIEKYRWWATTPGVSEKVGIHLSVDPQSSITLPAFGWGGKQNTFTIHLEVIDNDGGSTLAEDVVTSLPEVKVVNEETEGHTTDFFMDRSSLGVGEEFIFTAKIQNPLATKSPIAPTSGIWMGMEYWMTPRVHRQHMSLILPANMMFVLRWSTEG